MPTHTHDFILRMTESYPRDNDSATFSYTHYVYFTHISDSSVNNKCADLAPKSADRAAVLVCLLKSFVFSGPKYNLSQILNMLSKSRISSYTVDNEYFNYHLIETRNGIVLQLGSVCRRL